MLCYYCYYHYYYHYYSYYPPITITHQLPSITYHPSPTIHHLLPITAASNSTTTAGKDRALNQNKLLASKKKDRFAPYAQTCKLCKQSLHQEGSQYCQGCAYKQGICAMCGVKILDTSMYKQSSK